MMLIAKEHRIMIRITIIIVFNIIFSVDEFKGNNFRTNRLFLDRLKKLTYRNSNTCHVGIELSYHSFDNFVFMYFTLITCK